MSPDVRQAEPPEGLVYRPELVDEAEEAALLAMMEEVGFGEVRMHGMTAGRTVAHFGYTYDYGSWQLMPAAPMPSPLLSLRGRCGDLADLPGEDLAQALVTRYPAGSTIGWHRDASVFGPKVVGVSLLSDCRMLFRHDVGGVRRQYGLELARRSAYVLAGAARSSWQHSIPAAPALRYSITFRMVRVRACQARTARARGHASFARRSPAR